MGIDPGYSALLSPEEEQGGVAVRVRTHLKPLIIALGEMVFDTWKLLDCLWD